MRTIACIVAPFALAATAACNSPATGNRDQLSFTPINCGNPLLGCTVADGLAVGAAIDLEIRGLNGRSTDGITLSSATPAVIEVVDAPDGAAPTWEVHGLADGTAIISAVDAGGVEVDTLDFSVVAPERLSLVKIVGMAEGPTDEDGAQAWDVPAGALVSFQSLAWKEDYRVTGRFEQRFSVPSGSTLLDTQQSATDLPSGYLYVQPPAGDYTFTFEMAANPAISVDGVLHAR